MDLLFQALARIEAAAPASHAEIERVRAGVTQLAEQVRQLHSDIVLESIVHRETDDRLKERDRRIEELTALLAQTRSRAQEIVKRAEAQAAAHARDLQAASQELRHEKELRQVAQSQASQLRQSLEREHQALLAARSREYEIQLSGLKAALGERDARIKELSSALVEFDRAVKDGQARLEAARDQKESLSAESERRIGALGIELAREKELRQSAQNRVAELQFTVIQSGQQQAFSESERARLDEAIAENERLESALRRQNDEMTRLRHMNESLMATLKLERDRDRKERAETELAAHLETSRQKPAPTLEIKDPSLTQAVDSLSAIRGYLFDLPDAGE